MKHPHDGWNPKRIDPEPEKAETCSRCEWREWERFVWLATLLVAVPIVAIILGNVTGGGA